MTSREGRFLNHGQPVADDLAAAFAASASRRWLHPAGALVERRATGDALTVLNAVLTWETP